MKNSNISVKKYHQRPKFGAILVKLKLMMYVEYMNKLDLLAMLYEMKYNAVEDMMKVRKILVKFSRVDTLVNGIKRNILCRFK
ncbi:hypothetical protein WICPIJ_004884 [Wickerhamomyces pijperi]|uniref:Uncharacterized protein n=1 Tax=Wickerhamomyces pijperi TaxID=599730 RepID=A0A9P8TMH0_WICPI|nr:hypothetical protein WICPIJ_004884 [Wickerhamomyces pijperi]